MTARRRYIPYDRDRRFEDLSNDFARAGDEATRRIDPQNHDFCRSVPSQIDGISDVARRSRTNRSLDICDNSNTTRNLLRPCFHQPDEKKGGKERKDASYCCPRARYVPIFDHCFRIVLPRKPQLRNVKTQDLRLQIGSTLGIAHEFFWLGRPSRLTSCRIAR